MKISDAYKQMLDRQIGDLPPLSDFPSFSAPNKSLPDKDTPMRDYSDEEVGYYYNLAGAFLSAAEEALKSYNSYETYYSNCLAEARNKAYIKNFGGSNKGGNADNRNAVIDTDPEVMEINQEYTALKLQRQRMEGKVRAINQMVIQFGGERKHRREIRWTGSEVGSQQESF